MLTARNKERAAARHARPAPVRTYDAVREIACQAVSVNYVRRGVSQAASPQEALRDVFSTALTESWETEELSAVVSPELRREPRPIFAGQTRASGRPLAPLTRL